MIFSATKLKPTRLTSYINNYANKSRKQRSYKRAFWNLARKLTAYEEYREIEIMTDNFSENTFEDFLYFLKESYPYRSGTLVKFKALLVTIMHAAKRNDYKVDFSFANYRFKQEDESHAVYLTENEIERIFNLKKREANIQAIRDRFVIGCVTGLRYSDFSKLTISNIVNNTVQIRTRKTAAKVILPVHWMVTEILKRNNGELPEIKCSRQNFNKVIKNLCRSAKINNTILIERTEGNKIVRQKVKKYKMVSSHTARRSFATNSYIAKIPTAKIMLLTGHKTEEAFFRYIRFGKQENAEDLSTHPFFTKNPANR